MSLFWPGAFVFRGLRTETHLIECLIGRSVRISPSRRKTAKAPGQLTLLLDVYRATGILVFHAVGPRPKRELTVPAVLRLSAIGPLVLYLLSREGPNEPQGCLSLGMFQGLRRHVFISLGVACDGLKRYQGKTGHATLSD